MRFYQYRTSRPLRSASHLSSSTGWKPPTQTRSVQLERQGSRYGRESGRSYRLVMFSIGSASTGDEAPNMLTAITTIKEARACPDRIAQTYRQHAFIHVLDAALALNSLDYHEKKREFYGRRRLTAGLFGHLFVPLALL